MDDDKILERGGTEEDIKKYAEQNGADFMEETKPTDCEHCAFSNHKDSVDMGENYIGCLYCNRKIFFNRQNGDIYYPKSVDWNRDVYNDKGELIQKGVEIESWEEQFNKDFNFIFDDKIKNAINKTELWSFIRNTVKSVESAAYERGKGDKSFISDKITEQYTKNIFAEGYKAGGLKAKQEERAEIIAMCEEMKENTTEKDSDAEWAVKMHKKRIIDDIITRLKEKKENWQEDIKTKVEKILFQHKLGGLSYWTPDEFIDFVNGKKLEWGAKDFSERFEGVMKELADEETKPKDREGLLQEWLLDNVDMKHSPESAAEWWIEKLESQRSKILAMIEEEQNPYENIKLSVERSNSDIAAVEKGKYLGFGRAKEDIISKIKEL